VTKYKFSSQKGLPIHDQTFAVIESYKSMTILFGHCYASIFVKTRRLPGAVTAVYAYDVALDVALDVELDVARDVACFRIPAWTIYELSRGF
jgi:hypothetical protein